jgi:hypothetical protein
MLATQPPQTTLEWSLKLPEGAYRTRAQQTALEGWLRQDATAAASWLDQVPAGGQRDQLIATLVQYLRHIDPETARRWADSISDGKQRTETKREAGL